MGNIPSTPRGTNLSCQGWSQEGALRLLLNNLDPQVAEKPDELIVYGGTGKAARDFKCLNAIIATLKALKNDETLLVQSGKPVAVVPTHDEAPRVIIVNSVLVPKWADWPHFRALEAKGLTMYGQMTAGSWIYIGSQGIVQGTYETFAAVANKHYGGSLAGRLLVTGGLGGMGGAQPLAAVMNGAVCLAAEVDAERIERRLRTRYVDEVAPDITSAVKTAVAYKAAKKARSIAVRANIVDLLEYLRDSHIEIDVLTDQTSAHDALNGYVPNGMTYEEALALRAKDPESYIARAIQTMVRHTELMVWFYRQGVPTFDYGNNLRGQALEGGYDDAFAFPGFMAAYVRPLFCQGKGPFRWVALSGDPADIDATDQAIVECFPDDAPLHRWMRLARERVAFQGLPSRICWLGLGERAAAGERFNELVKTGKVSAPIAVGRDHLDSGSVASPNRETEGMRDGSDAIGDWPVLNFAVNAVSGASWVSFHHGGGVGMGYSLHAGQVIVLDGSESAGRRARRVFHNDPALGVIRHADAGYESAIQCAVEQGVQMPMLPKGGGQGGAP